MRSSSSSAGHCPPTIHELLCCLRNSQEPCRHSCHASSMICRGQRIAVEGRRGMLLPACRLQPAGVEALVRTKKNLHGGILKRLLVVCFNGGKKEQRRKLTVWGAWQCLEIPIHAILVSPDINSAAIPSADNSPFLSLFGGFYKKLKRQSSLLRCSFWNREIEECGLPVLPLLRAYQPLHISILQCK